MLLIRFPKNREIAEKWNVALGFEAEKIIHGLVCVEHFEDDQFKRRNKTELKPHAVPIVTKHIEKIQNDDVLESNDAIESLVESIEVSATSTSVASDTNNDQSSNNVIKSIQSSQAVEILDSCVTEHIPNRSSTPCKDCVKKNYTINKQQEEIEQLRKKLREANAKISYSEKTRRKLDITISELKKQQLLNEELCNSLEV